MTEKNRIQNDFEKIYTQKIFSRPMTPSYWKSREMTYTPITRIKMTCGGGMGGSQWYEYIKRIPLETLASEHNMLIVETLEEEKKLINLNYVVSAEQLTVGSAELYSQNKNYPTGIYTYRILLKDGHKVTLTQ